MSHDWKMAICTAALLEGAAILVLAVMILSAYHKSPKLRHVAVMAFTVLGTVGGVLARMWEGGMDDDPWMVFWFMAMFLGKLYALWWFYDHRPGGHAELASKGESST